MRMTAIRLEAATLVAEDRLTDDAIAAQLGIHRATLARWKNNAAFAAKVQQHATRLSDHALNHGIARKDNRLSVLQEMHNRLLRTIEERAADPAMAQVPGGKTGLIVRKGLVSSGKLVAYEYAVDIATLKELRAIGEQAARELGQIVDKRELAGKDGSPLLTIEVLDQILRNTGDDELEKLLANCQERQELGSGDE
jgi:hypothetical protein